MNGCMAVGKSAGFIAGKTTCIIAIYSYDIIMICNVNV